MKRYINLRKVKINAFISRAFIIIGLGLLIGSLILSFTRPQLMTQLFVAVLIGTVISQVGLALHSRWGNSPRADELIDDALKGLDDRYAIFHYRLGTDHALISPVGNFALIPRLEEGSITYDGKRWWAKQERRGLLRRGSRRSLGVLENEAHTSASRLKRFLTQKLSIDRDIHTDSIVLFLHQNAQVQIDDPPVLTSHVKKLKILLRRMPKSKSLSSNEISLLSESLGF